MSPQIDLIFVPQGAEYQSVCKGLRGLENPPTVVPIPVGPRGVSQFLHQWLQESSWQMWSHALLMGLGGSLSDQLSVGDVVIYQTCLDGQAGGAVGITCDAQILVGLTQGVSGRGRLTIGVSCDRIINTTAEKRQLAHTHQAEVVDMEGFALLSGLQAAQIPLGIIRVISDDAHHDLPDLNGAISPSGDLQPLPLALGMLRQPLPALRLIRGSLKALKQLEEVTHQLFKASV